MSMSTPPEGLPGSGTGALDDQPGRVVFRCKDSAIIRTAQVIEWILRPNSLQGGTGFPGKDKEFPGHIRSGEIGGRIGLRIAFGLGIGKEHLKTNTTILCQFQKKTVFLSSSK